MPQRVYFFRSPSTGHIKIGCGSYVRGRMDNISRQRGEPLEFLAAFEADFDTEKALHERFKDSRVTGEWFEPVEDLLCVVEAVKARTEDSLWQEEHLDLDLMSVGPAADYLGMTIKDFDNVLRRLEVRTFLTNLGRRRFLLADLDKLAEFLDSAEEPFFQ